MLYNKPLSGRNKFLLALLAAAVIISVVLTLFVTSPAFVKAVAVYAGNLTGMRVEIGSLSIEKRSHIIIERLIAEKEKDGFRLAVPYAEIDFTLNGLLRKNIEGLTLRNPELSVTLKKDAPARTSLPVTFNALSVSEADVTLHYEDSEPLHISPVTLTLIKQQTGKYGDLRGKAYISGLNTTASLVSVMDMETFDLEKMRIDVSPIDLGNASAKYPLSLLSLKQLQGTCSLSLDMVRDDKEHDMVFQAEVMLEKLSVHTESLRVNPGDSPLKISAKGRYSSARLQGALEVQGKELAIGNTALQAFSASLPFEYQEKSLLIKKSLMQAGTISHKSMDNKTGSEFSFQDVKLDIASLSYKNSLFLADHVHLRAGRAAVYRNGKESFTENNILIKGDMEGDIPGHLFKGKNLLIDAGFFRGLAASADISIVEPVTVNAEIKYKDIDLEAVSEKFLHGFFTKKGYTVAGTGALHMTGKIVIPKDGPSHISGVTGLDLTNAGLSSPDGSVTCEGILMKASAKFESSLPDGPVSFSAEADAGGFELLAGKFYGSFKDRPIALSASGTYSGKSDTLHKITAKTGLSGIGEIVLTGSISDISTSPYVDASLHVADISNGETYNFFVRETFQEQLPILSGLDVSGKSSADLIVKGTEESFTVSGDVRIEGMNISDGTKDKSLSGVQVSLPVDLAYPEPLHERKAERFGTITIKDLSWSAVRMRDIVMSPSLRQNELVFKDDIRVPLFGGEVVMKDISYGSIFSDKKQLLLSVGIKELDIEKASVALELPKFSGHLSGAIPRVSIAGNRILTEGGIVLTLFGGEIKISDLSADNIFSPAPSLKAGIEVNEIDLGKLTGTFDFGHISGIIRGEISELVIVNGQAEHFRASLETYKKKGVEQKISVDALKKISILGTGVSTSILDKGIYQLFKEYGYEKIGFSAYLKNDNLLLLGIDDGEDRRYLVKGSLLPPKVNVINFNRNISFKEMVGRLKRITAAEK